MADPLTIGMAGAGALSGLLGGADSNQKKLARISEKEFVRRSTIEDEDRARKLGQDQMLRPVRLQLLQALAGRLGLPPEIMSALAGASGDRQVGDLPPTRPMPVAGDQPIGDLPPRRPMPIDERNAHGAGPVPLGGNRTALDGIELGDLPPTQPRRLPTGGEISDLAPWRPQVVPTGDQEVGDLPPRRPSTLDEFGGAGSRAPMLRRLLAGRLGMVR